MSDVYATALKKLHADQGLCEGGNPAHSYLRERLEHLPDCDRYEIEQLAIGRQQLHGCSRDEALVWAWGQMRGAAEGKEKVPKKLERHWQESAERDD
jgi:hypothetical protein